MTSSDVLDTTFNVCSLCAPPICFWLNMDALLDALKRRALEHKFTIRMGRSHGIHAEPTTMGLTLARFYAEMARNRDRLGLPRVPKWRQARFPERLAPSPISTLRWKRMSARRWGFSQNRSAHRSSPATATPCSLPRWA